MGIFSSQNKKTDRNEWSKFWENQIEWKTTQFEEGLRKKKHTTENACEVFREKEREKETKIVSVIASACIFKAENVKILYMCLRCCCVCALLLSLFLHINTPFPCSATAAAADVAVDSSFSLALFFIFFFHVVASNKS